ncbi:uncharacterized protein LOC108852909 [Raphanus sativus]|uniref:Uncharacterized protein LOC108852909 n=1 Tax=Raphanus sativus TaxID=3726 RepID=A0A9W3DJC3_RAPSA|nr:uncharacterized protein LOC108852909 [Raphanus sativus]
MDRKPPLENVIDDAVDLSSNNSSSSISTHLTATPDPRWPSKFRWSMESPPPAISTSTVSIEKTIAGSELSSTPSPASYDDKDMHQKDVINLEVIPKDSSEAQTEKKMGASNSGVEPVLEAARDNITSSEIISSENKMGTINTGVEQVLEGVGDIVVSSEITSQQESEDVRNTCVLDSRSPQSTGIPPIITGSPKKSVDSAVATFVPSIGAWARPLAFTPPATPPMPATPSDFNPQHLNNLLDSFWPTLTDGTGPNQKKRNHPSVVREFPRMPVQKIPVPELKEDGTLRFPWAARMDPATRNLYRAAKPTFDLMERLR